MDTAIRTPIAFKEILVATDFSDASIGALGYAVAIAKQFQAHVKLIHVSEPLSPTVIPEGDWFKEEIVREADRLENLGNSLREEGLSVDAVNAVGDIRGEILSCVKRGSVDLVVLGTHGKKGFERLLFGSNAEELARKISCPVLTIGPASPVLDLGSWSPKTILCATNTDHEHWKTAEYACSLARAMNATLTIVTVRDPKDAERGEIGSLREASTCSIATTEAEEVRFHIRCDLKEGGPASAITKVAREGNMDLIVMGATESHWPVSHFGKGVLAGVFANAPCPVLTIQVH